LPDQLWTSTFGPDTISESGRLWSDFHQKRYAINARRRYIANPVIRTPNTNFILSSVKNDFDFFGTFEALADFLPAHLRSIKLHPKGNNFGPYFKSLKKMLNYSEKTEDRS
jgi:hypothetical protein